MEVMIYPTSNPQPTQPQFRVASGSCAKTYLDTSTKQYKAKAVLDGNSYPSALTTWTYTYSDTDSAGYNRYAYGADICSNAAIDNSFKYFDPVTQTVVTQTGGSSTGGVGCLATTCSKASPAWNNDYLKVAGLVNGPGVYAQSMNDGSSQTRDPTGIVSPGGDICSAMGLSCTQHMATYGTSQTLPSPFRSVQSTVSLAGISGAQFDTATRTSFKQVIASYLKICGAAVSTTVTTGANAANTIVVASVDAVEQGMAVTGTGIHADATVSLVTVSTKTVTLSQPNTADLAAGSVVIFGTQCTSTDVTMESFSGTVGVAASYSTSVEFYVITTTNTIANIGATILQTALTAPTFKTTLNAKGGNLATVTPAVTVAGAPTVLTVTSPRVYRSTKTVSVSEITTFVQGGWGKGAPIVSSIVGGGAVKGMSSLLEGGFRMAQRTMTACPTYDGVQTPTMCMQTITKFSTCAGTTPTGTTGQQFDNTGLLTASYSYPLNIYESFKGRQCHTLSLSATSKTSMQFECSFQTYGNGYRSLVTFYPQTADCSGEFYTEAASGQGYCLNADPSGANPSAGVGLSCSETPEEYYVTISYQLMAAMPKYCSSEYKSGAQPFVADADATATCSCSGTQTPDFTEDFSFPSTIYQPNGLYQSNDPTIYGSTVSGSSPNQKHTGTPVTNGVTGVNTAPMLTRYQINKGLPYYKCKDYVKPRPYNQYTTPFSGTTTTNLPTTEDTYHDSYFAPAPAPTSNTVQLDNSRNCYCKDPGFYPKTSTTVNKGMLQRTCKLTDASATYPTYDLENCVTTPYPITSTTPGTPSHSSTTFTDTGVTENITDISSPVTGIVNNLVISTGMCYSDKFSLGDTLSVMIKCKYPRNNGDWTQNPDREHVPAGPFTNGLPGPVFNTARSPEYPQQIDCVVNFYPNLNCYGPAVRTTYVTNPTDEAIVTPQYVPQTFVNVWNKQVAPSAIQGDTEYTAVASGTAGSLTTEITETIGGTAYHYTTAVSFTINSVKRPTVQSGYLAKCRGFNSERRTSEMDDSGLADSDIVGVAFGCFLAGLFIAAGAMAMMAPKPAATKGV